MMPHNTEFLQPQYLDEDVLRKILCRETGGEWSLESFYAMAANLGYIEKIKEDWQWQPTKKAKPFGDFRNGIIKWNTEFVDLILQQLPKQLTLDI
ncbi:hypothetical protein [Aphanizomenon flos-aquae]|uniref:Uncharacterized protein n=1 Tax=Aphanizomenon flos-aquae FACHB-1040 TaxID=2692887 RepID=A0ABR8BZH5_APHFL|nr:hypothetical protein [Aphanizomenon flos-aquae]MBD2280244.1 hypothetical protein [Aphanizomenon flos-aquae FACHB-1040]